jgi:hypothetical protein
MKQFGETVEGYNIPVLNEREIRASAGILFAFLVICVMTAILKQEFLLLKYFIVIFLTDFIIRLFISPKYSPTLIIGRLIVSRQNPEYVGAAQKKFAWYIGLFLAVVMFYLSIVLNSFSPITGIICLICQIFLLFESAFGICLGCLVFHWFKKEKAQYCPGEICDVKAKQEIQKTSMAQFLVVIGFIVFFIAVVILFNDTFSVKSHALWDFIGSPI